MKVKLICSEYVKSITGKELERPNVIDLYHESFSSSGELLKDKYFRYYAPYNKEYMEDRIYDCYKKINENPAAFEQLCKFGLDDSVITSFVDYLSIRDDSVLTDININLFLGVGSCKGFALPLQDKVYINIALEKFFDVESPQKAISALIIHELTHAIRCLVCRPHISRLGDVLIEEGLACLVTEEVLNLTREDEGLIYPGEIEIESSAHYKKLSEIYVENIYAKDEQLIKRFMNLGDAEYGIKPGLGYKIGVDFIKLYIRRKKSSAAEAFYVNNDEIIELIGNEW